MRTSKSKYDCAKCKYKTDYFIYNILYNEIVFQFQHALLTISQLWSTNNKIRFIYVEIRIFFFFIITGQCMIFVRIRKLHKQSFSMPNKKKWKTSNIVDSSCYILLLFLSRKHYRSSLRFAFRLSYSRLIVLFNAWKV